MSMPGAGLDLDNGIAVIGMACRFPGATGLEEYWANLVAGVESIAFFSPEELAASGVDPELAVDPDYVPARGVIAGAGDFDADFFGYSPREALVLDPQQRVLLECAWEALEHAGYPPRECQAPVGVYAGASPSSYLRLLLADRTRLATVSDYELKLGNTSDFLCTRIAYKLGLTGPAVTVQTACSTSLVAVHLACQGLLAGECDLALAGGVTIELPQRAGYLHREGGILSRDGHCRALDAAASGTVGGDGAGIVVLKRLAEALTDGDHIHAVVRGSAINNDGADKIGFTAPSVGAQVAAIRAAQVVAGVEPETITYVEAHGTGTPLGDPIEVAALTAAFGSTAGKRQYCAIGSVKTNLGHTDAAAGVAGLIKTVLALERGAIPPSLHFTEPSPELDLAAGPFYVNVAARPWKPAAGLPRRAGVNSLGVGGTNAHVVLEEAPAAGSRAAARAWQLLPWSAKTPTALAEGGRQLTGWLDRHADIPLSDVAYTLQVGRPAHPWRRFAVCGPGDDPVAVLHDSERMPTAAVPPDTPVPAVAFMFPGQGSQHVGMGRELYESEPVFREQVDSCSVELVDELGHDLRRLLYPDIWGSPASAGSLDDIGLGQPALFVVEYALARLWQHRGVQPAAMIGHSVGELAAACVAGVFGEADALRLVARRAALLQSLPPGAMLAIPLPEDEVRSRLEAGSPGELSLAAVNSPSWCVVAGSPDAAERLAARLDGEGVLCRRLHVARAGHSPMVEAVAPSFEAYVEQVERRPPTVPFISNVTGTWITPEEATSPAYWARHLRRPVRFADGVTTLLDDPSVVLLEVGPSRTLATHVRGHARLSGEHRLVTTLPHPKDDLGDAASALSATGTLWLAGQPIRWAGLHPEGQPRRTPLPAYPFERRTYLPDVPAAMPPGGEPGRRPAAEKDVRGRGHAPAGDQPDGVRATVAGVFQEVLQLDDVGPDANFFALGGDSLIAIQLIMRIREVFAVPVPPAAIVRAPTVGQLSQVIETLLAEAATS